MSKGKGYEVQSDQAAYQQPTYVVTQPGVPPTHAKVAGEYGSEHQTLLVNPAGGENQGERFASDSYWRDVPFLVAFLLHIAGLFVIIGFGNATPVQCDNWNGWLFSCNFGQGDFSSAYPYLYVTATLAATAIILAGVYLQLLRAFPLVMIWAGIFLNCAAAVGFAIYLGVNQVIWGAVVFGIWALFIIIYFFIIRSRIPFAVEMIRTASSVVSMFPGTQILSYLSIFVKIGFFALWSYTVFLSQRFQQTPSIIAQVFLVFSFYWTFEVIKNVVHVSVSGVVATWYFMANNMPANPTLGAFNRAMTTSLGSIAFGSLIVAVIKTLRTILRAAMNRGSRNWIVLILSWIALCFLGCLDRLAEYFNHYAFCQVAIYGKTYIQAAKATWNLMKHAGLQAIVNDNLIDGVLWMGVLFGAIGTGFIGFVLASFIWVAVYPWAGFGIGFLIGFILLILAMQCLDSAVATIFVCFAEDKESLRATQPVLYQHLMETYYNVDV